MRTEVIITLRNIGRYPDKKRITIIPIAIRGYQGLDQGIIYDEVCFSLKILGVDPQSQVKKTNSCRIFLNFEEHGLHKMITRHMPVIRATIFACGYEELFKAETATNNK